MDELRIYATGLTVHVHRTSNWPAWRAVKVGFALRLRLHRLSGAETLAFLVGKWSTRKISLAVSIFPEIFVFRDAVSAAVDTVAENPVPDQRCHFQFSCHPT